MNVQALKDKLSKAAKELDLPFNEIWHKLVLERFLVRLARSDQANNFILKGGSLLARYLDINRETKDLDFLLTKMKSEKAVVTKAIESVASTQISDGFSFVLLSVDDLAHTHMKYPGFSAKLSSNFSGMRGQIEIDIGFGDVVEPQEEELSLLVAKGKAIFEDSVSLLAYPPEAIFAEKLQTAIVRGGDNSRMKDYHDLLSMISADLLQRDKVRAAIRKTFENRGTATETFALEFPPEGLEKLQKYWGAYLKRRDTEATQLPPQIEVAITQINDWVSQALR